MKGLHAFYFKTNINIYIYIYIYIYKSNTFISNARPKLAKNQARAKQHPEAEL